MNCHPDRSGGTSSLLSNANAEVDWQCESTALNPLLLPLDRARWLGSNVVDDAVDAPYLVDNPRRDSFQDFMGQLHPVSSHSVFRTDRPDRAGVSIGSVVAHHADRPDWQQDGE